MLADHHRELLRSSGISDEVSDERGYFSASTRAMLAQLGLGRAAQLPPALVIPLWDVFGTAVGYQVRPDDPRERGGRVVKYETPTRQPNSFDVPPRCQQALDDPEVPIVITEGSRKADAAAARGMCAISISGVYGWRTTNDKGGKVALPDFDAIAWNGRRVVLAFDSDAMTKPEVHEALRRLRALLAKRKAEVTVAYLPALDSGAKVGLDDWLAADPDRHFAELAAICRDTLDDVEAVEAEDDFADVEDEPGWMVLDDITLVLERFIHFSSEHHPVAVALWCAHTHALDCFDISPRLRIPSVVKRCGKSHLADLVHDLSRRPRLTINISVAAMFRLAEALSPTFVFDESDNSIGTRVDEGNKELVALVNAGYERGRTVTRMVGEGAAMEPAEFEVFSAVCLAGIGDVVDTIEDRSITVPLERLAPGEKVESFRRRQVRAVTPTLARRLAAWAARHGEEIAATPPVMAAGVRDRAADCWEPLLAIADAAGGPWPGLARAACSSIVGAAELDEKDASLPLRLLRDVAIVWPDDAPSVFSATLVEALDELEDAPWSEFGRGRGLSQNRMARYLKGFELRPLTVRIGDDVKKGYHWHDFVPVWRRYEIDPEHPPSVVDAPGTPPLKHPSQPAQPLPEALPGLEVTDGTDATAAEKGCTGSADDTSDGDVRSIDDIISEIERGF